MEPSIVILELASAIKELEVFTAGSLWKTKSPLISSWQSAPACRFNCADGEISEGEGASEEAKGAASAGESVSVPPPGSGAGGGGQVG